MSVATSGIPYAPAPQNLEAKESLLQSLDELLERYVNLLDQYTALQQELQLSLSAGYIALAKANFSTSNRVRYGRDFYDERMQACHVVNTVSSNPAFSTADSLPLVNNETSLNDNPERPSLDGNKSNSTNRDSDTPENTKGDAEDPKATPSHCDPLKWFGILVPHDLRHSQASFRQAVSTMPSLASLAKELQEVEMEVRRARKKMGEMERR